MPSDLDLPLLKLLYEFWLSPIITTSCPISWLKLFSSLILPRAEFVT
jgi:hypothetical protein